MTPANLAFGLGVLSLLLYAAEGGGWKPAGRAAGGALAAALLSLTWDLGVRWHASGRPPMANQYESLLVMSWFLGLGGLWARRRMTAAGLIGGALFCAALGAASFFDRSIQPLMPALRSNWLAYHVLTAMASYAAFALAAAGGVYGLISARAAPGRAEEFSAGAVRMGFFLLTLGIVTGAVWAQQAWGSYWSWDPKETWSAITWLVYAVILHLRRSRMLSGKGFSWACLAGFAAVIFTYFGVNFLLGGLHSYSGT